MKLTFGDSITYGVDSDVNGWANMLRSLIERRHKDAYYDVYNLGIPGDTSRGLLRRIKGELVPRSCGHKNTYVVINIGGNDIMKAEFMFNLENIIEICKDFSSNIFVGSVLDTVPEVIEKQEWFDGIMDRYQGVDFYNDIIKQVCKSHNVNYIDTFSVIKPSMLIDGLHPNAEGNREYCYTVYRTLSNYWEGEKK